MKITMPDWAAVDSTFLEPALCTTPVRYLFTRNEGWLLQSEREIINECAIGEFQKPTKNK